MTSFLKALSSGQTSRQITLQVFLKSSEHYVGCWTYNRQDRCRLHRHKADRGVDARGPSGDLRPLWSPSIVSTHDMWPQPGCPLQRVGMPMMLWTWEHCLRLRPPQAASHLHSPPGLSHYTWQVAFWEEAETHAPADPPGPLLHITSSPALQVLKSSHSASDLDNPPPSIHSWPANPTHLSPGHHPRRGTDCDQGQDAPDTFLGENQTNSPHWGHPYSQWSLPTLVLHPRGRAQLHQECRQDMSNGQKGHGWDATGEEQLD